MTSKARHALGKNGSKSVLGRFPFSRSCRPKRIGSGELSGKVQGAHFENSCVPFNRFNPISPGPGGGGGGASKAHLYRFESIDTAVMKLEG